MSDPERNSTGDSGDGRLDHAAIAGELEAWFASAKRDLPWRREADTGRRDAYHALVAETMLQQTQVSRVLGKYAAFIERFPTVTDLARAHEDEVLALWSGLGYYRRARNLHAAAKQVASEFDGDMPRTATELQRLKGVGKYTAGAIASIVFGERAPIVDGNVQRVVRRLTNDDRPIADRDAERDVWRHAEALAASAPDPAATNEALMELGALICTPRQPRCLHCPLRERCGARAAGREDAIPPPKTPAAKRDVFHAAAIVRDNRGRLLIEQRPATGLWAGLWQPVTAERDDGPPTRRAIERELGLAIQPSPRETFVHQTSHRTVHFSVYEGERRPDAPPRRGSFRTAGAIATLALANPHRRLLLSSD